MKWSHIRRQALAAALMGGFACVPLPAAVELRGVMTTSTDTKYDLYDSVNGASVWLGVNESVNGITIKAVDPVSGSLSVTVDGRLLSLAMAPSQTLPSVEPAGSVLPAARREDQDGWKPLAKPAPAASSPDLAPPAELASRHAEISFAAPPATVITPDPHAPSQDRGRRPEIVSEPAIVLSPIPYGGAWMTPPPANLLPPMAERTTKNGLASSSVAVTARAMIGRRRSLLP